MSVKKEILQRLQRPHLGAAHPTPPASWPASLGWGTVIILPSENTISINYTWEKGKKDKRIAHQKKSRYILTSLGREVCLSPPSFSYKALT